MLADRYAVLLCIGRSDGRLGDNHDIRGRSGDGRQKKKAFATEGGPRGLFGRDVSLAGIVADVSALAR